MEFGKERAGRQSRLLLPVPRTELMAAWITVGGEMAWSELASEVRLGKAWERGSPGLIVRVRASAAGETVALDLHEGKDEEMLVEKCTCPVDMSLNLKRHFQAKDTDVESGWPAPPVPSPGHQAHKALMWGLMSCCQWTSGPTFAFCPGPHKVDGSWF